MGKQRRMYPRPHIADEKVKNVKPPRSRDTQACRHIVRTKGPIFGITTDVKDIPFICLFSFYGLIADLILYKELYKIRPLS